MVGASVGAAVVVGASVVGALVGAAVVGAGVVGAGVVGAGSATTSQDGITFITVCCAGDPNALSCSRTKSAAWGDNPNASPAPLMACHLS